MNLANLITEAQRLAGRVDSLWNDRTRRWLNEAQTQWALAVPWPDLTRAESFWVSGATNQIVLPHRVMTVKKIADRTNKRPVRPNAQTDQEYSNELFSATTGPIDFWTEHGVQPVSRQPTAGGALQVYTTASDSFSLFVAGLAENTNASGTSEQFYFEKETLVVSSTSTYSTVKNYVRVDVLGKDDFTNGDVVVSDVSSNLLARLPANAFQCEYRVLQFVRIPDSAVQLDVWYLQRPTPLVDNAQLPPPAVDPEYLIWYAAGMIHSAQEGQEQSAQIKLARAREILDRRIAKERTQGDKDWRAIPEPLYWCNEDGYEVPANGASYGF